MEEIKVINSEHLEDSDTKLLRLGHGEWVEEIDLLEFIYKDHSCLIERNDFGSLCGYVIIPRAHPWFEKEIEAIPALAHGGITFCGKRLDRNGFFVGFDCSHYNDITPFSERLLGYESQILEKLYISSLKTYKNIAFCIEQCKSLVDQMIEAMNEKPS